MNNDAVARASKLPPGRNPVDTLARTRVRDVRRATHLALGLRDPVSLADGVARLPQRARAVGWVVAVSMLRLMRLSHGDLIRSSRILRHAGNHEASIRMGHLALAASPGTGDSYYALASAAWAGGETPLALAMALAAQDHGFAVPESAHLASNLEACFSGRRVEREGRHFPDGSCASVCPAEANAHASACAAPESTVVGSPTVLAPAPPEIAVPCGAADFSGGHETDSERAAGAPAYLLHVRDGLLGLRQWIRARYQRHVPERVRAWADVPRHPAAAIRAGVSWLRGHYRRHVPQPLRARVSDARRRCIRWLIVDVAAPVTLSAHSLERLGRFLQDRAEHDRAARLFQLALAVDPDRGSACVQLGIVALSTGRCRTAAAMLLAASHRGVDTFPLRNLLSYACMLSGLFELAESYSRPLKGRESPDPDVLQLLGDLLLAKGDEAAAARPLQAAARAHPALGAPHQNFAALHDRAEYARTHPRARPTRAELLFDGYNRAGERLIHHGRADEGITCFGNALRIQRELSRNRHVPTRFRRELEQLFGTLDERIRILPYEWVTQIGHLGMLDVYLKMAELGWTEPASHVLLAPPRKVVNHAYLDCWRHRLHVVDDADLAERMMPLLRRFGTSFNAFLNDDDTVSAWPDVGARAQIAWARRRGSALASVPREIVERGHQALRRHGLQDGDWFVALHVRESGYHEKRPGSGQDHRNASIHSYLPAVEAITRRGGWVVRLGDPSMTPMPPLDRVIDYALSPIKSEWMDVYLMSECRFFIGTTSGLTNAVLSFDRPSVLVNCLSNFSQLWSDKVIFTLKPMHHTDEDRLLSLREMIGSPVRSWTYDVDILLRNGIVPLDNTAEEILEVVEEMLDQLDRGRPAPWSQAAMDAYRRQLQAATNYGAARPSRDFVERYLGEIF